MKHINVEISDELLEQIEAVRESVGLYYGRRPTRSELVRRAIADQLGYGKLKLSATTVDPVQGELLRQRDGV